MAVFGCLITYISNDIALSRRRDRSTMLFQERDLFICDVGLFGILELIDLMILIILVALTVDLIISRAKIDASKEPPQDDCERKDIRFLVIKAWIPPCLRRRFNEVVQRLVSERENLQKKEERKEIYQYTSKQ